MTLAHRNVRLDLFSSKEAAAYLRRSDLAILPVGCFEMHGPRMPLGSPETFPDRHRNIDINGRVQKRLAQEVKLPPIYILCGAEDSHALPCNQEMHKFLKEQGVACEYLESPGKHDWPYWRDASPKVIDFHWRSPQ